MSDSPPSTPSPASSPTPEDPDRPRPRPIRFYGTTWTDHSGGYAARRLGLGLAALLLAAVGAAVLRTAYQGTTASGAPDWVHLPLVVVFAVCSSLAFTRTFTGFVRRRETAPDAAGEASARSILIIGFLGFLLAYALRSLLEAPGEKLLRAEHEEAVAAHKRGRTSRSGNPAHRRGRKSSR